MELIDEEDDFSFGFLDFVDDSLEALLEFSAILGSGNERREVERANLAPEEHLRNFTRHNLARDALDDRGLANSWVADEDRIIFRATREDLNRAIDLIFAPDDRVNLALSRQSREIDSVALKRRAIVCRFVVSLHSLFFKGIKILSTSFRT